MEVRLEFVAPTTKCFQIEKYVLPFCFLRSFPYFLFGFSIASLKKHRAELCLDSAGGTLIK